MPEPVDPAAAEAMKRILSAKEERRRELAALPIEEKVKRVVELQRLTNDIRRHCGRPPLPEWKL